MRATDRRRLSLTASVRAGIRRLALDEPRGLGLAGVGVLAFLEDMNGPADSSECGLVLARRGSRLNLRASAAQHSAYGVVAELRQFSAAVQQRFLLPEVIPRHSATWAFSSVAVASVATAAYARSLSFGMGVASAWHCA